MCLLHTHHKDTILADEWIEDFYDINGDGIGVMYSEVTDGKAQLVIKKCLPKNYAEAQEFYNAEIKGRECVVHWRMATHGDIDFDNCHPYVVLPLDSTCPMALMHNGILSNGNYKDKSKSDTWHYVNDYLKPLLDPMQGGSPDLIFKEPFVEILGDSIGSSNKFVAMDYLGNVSIINRSAGVNWNGIWLSNTYAWSAPRRLSRSNYTNYSNPQDAGWNSFDNKYYAAAHGDISTGEQLPALDYLDRPEPVYQYSKAPAASPKATPSSATKKDGKNKKGKSGKTTALVDHTGKVTGVVTHGTPIGPNGKTNAELLREEKEVTEMFDVLDDEDCTQAYVSLSYQNFYNFIDKTDIDTAWEAVYMHVDKVLDAETFIDYILDPQKWIDNPMPVHGKKNIGTADDHFTDEELDRIFAERDAAVVVDEATNEEVIEKTLPRIPAATGTGNDGRPIYDQRANANVFDIEGGQRVA